MLTLAAGHPVGSVTARYLRTHTGRRPPAGSTEEPLRNRPAGHPRRCAAGSTAQPALRGRRVHRPGRSHRRLSSRTPSATAPRPTRHGADLAAVGHAHRPLRTAVLRDRRACAPTELAQDTDTHLKGIAHDFSAPATPAAAGMSTPTPFPKQLDHDSRLPCLSGLARFRGAVFEDPEFG